MNTTDDTMNKPFEGENPIGLACDHAGFTMMCNVIKFLEKKNIPYTNVGTFSQDSVDYPEYGHRLAAMVEKGECSGGIAICGTGNGICMTVNHHQNIRASLCWNEEIAKFARAHNNANIICLPGQFISENEMEKILNTFFSTSFEGGRHERRIKEIPLK